MNWHVIKCSRRLKELDLFPTIRINRALPKWLQFELQLALPVSAVNHQSAQPQPAVSAGSAKVHITSSPSGGEIYVDGKFFGNTPSDLSLTTGEHAVKITVDGKEWTRTVQIITGEIHLHAAIE